MGCASSQGQEAGCGNMTSSGILEGHETTELCTYTLQRLPGIQIQAAFDGGHHGLWGG